ncbi:hypothetical protein HJC23_011311 [Cyclotella cryptica]|uniref:Membrane transporter protein n=1 Tax=Cyclotella cryptica TaxID=29204 RepID=A0ABD3QW00_9STRA|eukprot:CCRYP_001710-RA/>CCRYP_001710-RA protein AED:0.08 eAED:-0.10 QI:0/-1/0/1/-1/1/1/0/408
MAAAFAFPIAALNSRGVAALRTAASWPRNSRLRATVRQKTNDSRQASMPCGTRTMGVSPAWKRHLIRQQRRVHSSNNKLPPPSNHAGAPSQGHEQPPLHLSIQELKSFSIGTLAGLLGSLAGMGGGFVMIPLMTARTATKRGWAGGLGLTQHQAHGTSLFAVGTTGLAGALGYGIRVGGDDDVDDDHHHPEQPHASTLPRGGLVELDTALALTATAMITARLGAISSSFLSERLLQKCLGLFMICVAPLVPGKAYLEALHDIQDPSNPEALHHLQQDEAMHTHHKQLSSLERLLPSSLIGMFSGFLSGMFGVGGGAIVVPALVLTTDMSHHAAVGTSLCAMVLPAMVGTYTHAMRGNVHWRFGPFLALGSGVGAFVGGRMVGVHLEEDWLRGGFAVLMLGLGVKTLRK